MKKKIEYLEKLEKAISEKYGIETIQNPKASWTRLKEAEYLKQLHKLAKKQNCKLESDDKVVVDGVLIPKKLFMKETDRICASCGEYSFNIQDDLYMTKFKCCFECYVQYVEGREEKWLVEKLIEND
ncbi:MAG: hypothetical protein ACFFKA_07435 [Candidatus Thorarchaeota archaeon]